MLISSLRVLIHLGLRWQEARLRHKGGPRPQPHRGGEEESRRGEGRFRGALQARQGDPRRQGREGRHLRCVTWCSSQGDRVYVKLMLSPTRVVG